MKKMKQILTLAFACAAMLAIAGTAPAAQVDINIYGSSSQYLYWNAAAPGILTGFGCTNVKQAAFPGGKHAIAKGTCGSDTVYIRVSSKASFEGPRAVMGDDTNDNFTAPAERGSDGFSRQMVDEAYCTFGAANGNPTTGCIRLKSNRVTLGVSDVAAASLNQMSTGKLKGPNGGADTDRIFLDVSISGLNSYNPIIVPFAFFANNTVKQDPTFVANGNVYTPANAVTITNLSRLKAVLIFSGQIYNWQDFGKDFANVPAVACLRHAGSGTHAALDLAVMNGQWGANLLFQERASNPTVWFNDGSGDEMYCVNTLAGAVGYADADQSTSSYSSVVRLNYNGEAPTRSNIRNGHYDFFTMAWVYENPAAPDYSVTHPYVTAAMAYAANPANIPAAKAAYWATGAEMNFMKDSDFNYIGYVGATQPMLP